MNIEFGLSTCARFAPSRQHRVVGRRAPIAILTLAALGPVFAPNVTFAATFAQDEPTPEVAVDAPPPGIKLFDNVTFSGYVTTQFLVPDARSRAPQPADTLAVDDDSQYGHRARLDVSHLSGIAWWEPAPAWKVLGEIDLQDIVQIPAHSSEDGRASEPYAALDRLYLDYQASDTVSIRAGKFLTPIGRWNQEHSDPQVWTVLRPLISQSAFPTNATGLMLFGSVPLGTQWIDYQAYASDGGEWRPSPRSHPFGSAFGVRLSTSLNPSFQFGLSASRFQEEGLGSSRFNLMGADAALNWLGSELSAEIIQRRGKDANVGEEYGWFAQAAVPVSGRWWSVARLEEYRRAVDASRSSTTLLGVVYKSGHHWVFKAEWAHASGGSSGLPSGFLSSLTMVY